MKKIIIAVFIATVTLLSCTKETKDEPYNPDGSPITMEQAIEICKEEIDYYEEVYVSKTIVGKGLRITSSSNPTSVISTVPYDSWVVVINTEPLANSGKYWLYIYVNEYTGATDKDSWEWSRPEVFDVDMIKSPFSNVAKFPTEPLIATTGISRSNATPSNDWAVIISGGKNLYENHRRYWNDCSAIYKCLREVYNYRRDRIIVLMSDGTSSAIDRNMNDGTYISSSQDLDGDGTDDINYAATKSNITTVFNYLQNNVSTNGQVFIFVTDHGARVNDESYICLWNNTRISATEFANEVKKINRETRKQVVLGQCYSGGFVHTLSSACSNIVIATASSETEESWSRGDGQYDEFLYHWISAAAGKIPDTGAIVNADLNGYAGLSIEEIFKYADDRDGIEIEHSQYSSSPSSMGEQYGLSGEKFGYPVFTGISDISSSSSDNRFTLSDLPDNGSVSWQSSSNVSITSSSPTYANIVSSASEAMETGWVKASITTPSKTYNFNQDVYLWKPNINFTETLINGSLASGYFSLVYGCPNNTAYRWNVDATDIIDYDTGAPFVEFTPYTGQLPDEYCVSVDFTNPLGEGTSIVRRFEGEK